MGHCRYGRDRSGVAFGLAAPAALAVRGGRREPAACWLGTAEAIRAAIGEPVVVEQRAGHEAVVDVARRGLGEEAFARVWAAGRALSPEEAVAEALAEELTVDTN